MDGVHCPGSIFDQAETFKAEIALLDNWSLIGLNDEMKIKPGSKPAREKAAGGSPVPGPEPPVENLNCMNMYVVLYRNILH